MQRLLPLALFVLLSVPRVARAYEDATVLELGVGYAGSFGGGDTRPAGFRGDLGVLIGLSPSFSLGLRAEGGLVLDSEIETPFFAAGAEIVYAIDIVTAVPRFGLGVKPVFSMNRHGPDVDLGLDLILGLDFMLRRGPNLGIELRGTYLPTHQGSDLGPFMLGFTFRVGFPFER